MDRYYPGSDTPDAPWNLDYPDDCPECNGDGVVPVTECPAGCSDGEVCGDCEPCARVECEACGGAGTVPVPDPQDEADRSADDECDRRRDEEAGGRSGWQP